MPPEHILDSLASATWIGRWTPGVGDPGAMGWLTVASYGIAAWLCWRARGVAMAEARVGATHGSATLWGVFCAGLAALGVNKQLDLQSAATEAGRVLVRAWGWEAHKGTLQVLFVAGVLVVLLVGCAGLAWRARGDLRRVLPALLGGMALCAFVAVRAASFHHVDRVIGLAWAGLRMHHALELGGIAAIACCALRYRTPPRRS